MIIFGAKKPISLQRSLLAGFGLFCILGLVVSEQALAQAKNTQLNREVFACQPVTLGFQGETYEEEAQRRAAFARAEAVRRANAWPTEHVKISKKMKNPNSIKIPFSQAPGISADTREENGRRVCEHKSDKGNKSKQDGKDVHIDRECCLDPDEIPNPRCYYPQLGANNSPERVVGSDGKKYIK